MPLCTPPHRFVAFLKWTIPLFTVCFAICTSAPVTGQDLKSVAPAQNLQHFRTALERPVRDAKRTARDVEYTSIAKSSSTPVNEADSLALVELFNSTTETPWTNASNWLTGRVSTWYGITVFEDRVTRISLASNNLTGTLPSELGDLTAVTSLNLGIDIFESGENHLRGEIPSELGELTDLTRLWLDGNELTGPIPSSLGNLIDLESLDLGNFFGGNMLSGPIPSSLGNLKKLESLRLANNHLSGPIPASLGGLSVLEDIDLSGNELSGSIPSELGNLASVTVLSLGSFFGGNQLTGSIPASLGNLVTLESLLLGNNKLDGPIPPSIGQLSLLESLSLSGNQLSGSIPPELGNLHSIENLDLGLVVSGTDENGNFIVFSFPNQLTGEIPTSLGNLSLLASLYLGNNQLTGAIPLSFSNLTLLENLFLNCNQFNDLPSLASFSDLKTLLIENNRFRFNDVEPNVGVASDMYLYSPQASVPVTVTPAGADLELSVEADSPNNHYQWFLNGLPISGANESTHVISASDPNGVSAYHVEITNSVAVELRLSSLPTFSNIVVNELGDASDALLADGICDIDLQTPGSQCTFRAALEHLAQGSSQSCGSDRVEITFAGVDFIHPESPLPVISNSVLINGGTGDSRVEIRGESAGMTDGLTIQGRNITLRNLTINAFNGWGIRVNGGSESVIENSHIGVLSQQKTNTLGGILVEGNASSVTIGGLNASQENVIGGGIRVDGEGTQSIRILRNTLEIPETWTTNRPLRVPVDMAGDGPSCRAWLGEDNSVPNRGIPPPRVLDLQPGFVKGMARPGASVVVYKVISTGTHAGRYWARSVVPIGSGIADEMGVFDFNFDAPIEVGTQITLSMSDVAGNTSELSQVRRPVIYLPGVGGSWLEAENGDNLFIPFSSWDFGINALLRRLAMSESGEENLNGEEVSATGILEQLPNTEIDLPYGPVLERLEAAGFSGTTFNSNEKTLDLWRFWYDWRRDPTKLADRLKTLIDHITHNQPGDEVAAACEVDVATHSNGGMVASAYVWKSREHSQNKVNRLFMSAAPYLGAPQVFAAHTRGYLFEIEESIYSDFDWGGLVGVFLNLPDGYGLLPGRLYYDLVNPNAPMQSDWQLMDLYGNRLSGYQEIFDFLTAPKLNPENAKPLGLGRNGTMWTGQQVALHDLMNDWRSYNGPPQVFRHIGRLPQSTAITWPIYSNLRVEDIINSTRKETGDTDLHVAYRESLSSLRGWGDGTVPLVSATLGAGVTPDGAAVGLADYSGQQSDWIEPFEYFPCSHTGIVGTDCVGDTGNALDRTVNILKSSYEFVDPFSGKRGIPKSQHQTPESEVIYIVSSSPISVWVSDDTGARTGPTEGESLNKIKYEVPGIGYSASLAHATLWFSSEKSYTVVVEARGSDASIRVSRGQSEGDQIRNIFFQDQAVTDNGGLRFTLTPGGTAANTVFEVDTDGNGSYESVAAPLAEMMSDEPGPSIPRPEPFTIVKDIGIGALNPVASLRVAGAGGPIWNWKLEDLPAWIIPDASAGENPATIQFTLAASTLPAGIHRDKLTLVLTYDDFTTRQEIPVELAIRDQAATLSEILVQPANHLLIPGDSLQFWALGLDQLDLPISLTPRWTATGGSISDTGLFIAGSSTGVFTVSADDGVSISGSTAVEIISEVATESEETLPTAIELFQNYPNPFNPETTIRFALPNPENVSLEVYDLLGRQIAVLINELRSAGQHRIVFSHNDLPSGVYLYRLRAGAFQETKKMLLLK